MSRCWRGKDRTQGIARRTWAWPEGVEGIERDEERLCEVQRVQQLTVVLPQAETDGDLAGEPGHLEWAAGEKVALGLLDADHRLLDAVGDLALVKDCGEPQGYG